MATPKEKRIEEYKRMEKICDDFCMTQHCGDRDCKKCGYWALVLADYAPRNETRVEFAEEIKTLLRKDNIHFSTLKGVELALSIIDKLIRKYKGGG